MEYYKLALLITTGVKSADYLNDLFENALIQSDSSSGRRLTVDCLFSIKECWNLLTSLFNGSFPNYLWPLFQSESWCSSFHMKISFHSHANEN